MPADETGRDIEGRATLERTVAHELGHSAFLFHPKPGKQDGNLMHQTAEDNAGTQVSGDQIKEMHQNYTSGKLNND